MGEGHRQLGTGAKTSTTELHSLANTAGFVLAPPSDGIRTVIRRLTGICLQKTHTMTFRVSEVTLCGRSSVTKWAMNEHHLLFCSRTSVVFSGCNVSGINGMLPLLKFGCFALSVPVRCPRCCVTFSGTVVVRIGLDTHLARQGCWPF